MLAEKICRFKSGDWQRTTKSTVGQILRRFDVLIRVRSAHGQSYQHGKALKGWLKGKTRKGTKKTGHC